MIHPDWPLLTALTALVYVAGIAAAIHAVLTVRTTQSAIAWALCLVMIPWLAVLPYVVFGRSRMEGYVGARRLGDKLLGGRIGHHDRKLHWQSGDWRPKLAGGEALPRNGPEHQRLRALARLASTPPMAHNRVRLLIDGEATFDAVFAALAGARHLIIVQSFILRDDGIGRRLLRLLIDRAAAGVKVYVLIDGVGSHDLPAAYLDRLRAAGAQAHVFLAGRRLISRFQVNFRNHRKVVVVDGETGFVGGLNIGDEYLGLDRRLTPWRDTAVEVTGPAVAALQVAFAEDWYWITGEVPALRLSSQRVPDGVVCQVLPSGPADEQETCLLYFVEAIHSARDRIWLATPYFLPDDAVAVALRLAVLRGVDVRLLLPGVADHKIVYAASTLYAHEAVQAGVRVYRQREGFMHQKVVLIDHDTASVGSANIDNRSFRLNFEMTMVVVDPAFATEVEHMLERDFAAANRIDATEYTKAPPWYKIASRVARLFAPIL